MSEIEESKKAVDEITIAIKVHEDAIAALRKAADYLNVHIDSAKKRAGEKVLKLTWCSACKLVMRPKGGDGEMWTGGKWTHTLHTAANYRSASPEQIASSGVPIEDVPADLAAEVLRLREAKATGEVRLRPDETFEVTITPSGSSYAFDDVFHAMIGMKHPNFFVRYIKKVNPSVPPAEREGEN